MKRRLAILIVFLLLGAIVNVAVAWGFAWYQDAMPMASWPTGRSHAGDAAWHMRRVHQSGTDLILSTSITQIAPSVGPTADAAAITNYIRLKEAWERGESIADELGLDVFVPPRWSKTRSRPAVKRGDLNVYLQEEARGWPVRSVMCEERSTYDTGNNRLVNYRLVECVQRWALPLHGSQGPMGLARRLPFKPIWPGFAINTIFYAAILWLLFAAPFALRRWRRIKRGLCARCGYPWGTSAVCSECGTPISGRIAAHGAAGPLHSQVAEATGNPRSCNGMPNP